MPSKWWSRITQLFSPPKVSDEAYLEDILLKLEGEEIFLDWTYRKEPWRRIAGNTFEILYSCTDEEILRIIPRKGLEITIVYSTFERLISFSVGRYLRETYNRPKVHAMAQQILSITKYHLGKKHGNVLT